MFFPHKIRSIKPQDRILEIGPGGSPHPRADILLEKVFDDPKEAEGQRGYAPKVKTDKKIIYYNDDIFPFKDKEFDYVICSQVLEHIENIDAFISEINRVGKAGYFEYPLIYYDYIYNFPEHITFVKKYNDHIVWMPKADSGISKFNSINDFFYESFKMKYTSLVDDLKKYFFEGFEWFEEIRSFRTNKIQDLVLQDFHIPMHSGKKGTEPGFFERLRQTIKSRIFQ